MTGIELKAKSIYPEISKSEQLAADYFMKSKEDIFKYPLDGNVNKADVEIF